MNDNDNRDPQAQYPQAYENQLNLPAEVENLLQALRALLRAAAAGEVSREEATRQAQAVAEAATDPRVQREAQLLLAILAR